MPSSSFVELGSNLVIPFVTVFMKLTTKYKIVFVTVSSKAEAHTISSAIIQEKLAACATIVPSVSSIYWWQGKIEKSSELLLILKTTASCINPLIHRIKKLHSYTVPEIITLDIVNGNPDYLSWITDSTQCTKRSSKK